MTATILAALVVGSGSRAIATPVSTFSGRCALAGTVDFTPALKILPAPGSSSARFTGSCTGKLTRGDRTIQVSGATATYTAAGSGRAMSCGGGTSSGSGRLTIGGIPVDFTLSETRVGPVALLTLRGGTGMNGIVTIDPSAGIDAVSACGGAGLAKIPVKGSFTSLS